MNFARYRDEGSEAFLRKRGFSKVDTMKIIDAVLVEDGHPPDSIFDFVQGITRLARTKTRQDVRPDLGSGDGHAEGPPAARRTPQRHSN